MIFLFIFLINILNNIINIFYNIIYILYNNDNYGVWIRLFIKTKT